MLGSTAMAQHTPTRLIITPHSSQYCATCIYIMNRLSGRVTFRRKNKRAPRALLTVSALKRRVRAVVSLCPTPCAYTYTAQNGKGQEEQ